MRIISIIVLLPLKFFYDIFSVKITGFLIMDEKTKQFTVFVEQNSPYMENKGPVIHGVYDSYKAAYRACRFIVEDSIREFFDYDYTEEENYMLYLIYGLSPWFDPQGDGTGFSSADYAAEHIKNLYKWKCYLD